MDSELYGDLIGKPYKTYGTGPESYDCYGLVVEISKRYGETLPLYLYEDTWKGRDLVVDECRTRFIKVGIPREGDIIAIKVGKWVTHIGWMLDQGRFIHCTDKTGVVITRVDSPKYASRIEGYYRWKS